MSKAKIARIAIAALLLIIGIGAIGLYVWEIVVDNLPPEKNLFRMTALVLTSIVGFIRLFYGKGRGRNLGFYEKQFAEQIKNAFADSPKHRRKLLYGIKLYNESRDDRLDGAMKQFVALKPYCKSGDDFYAVYLFFALALTDAGLKNEAVSVYRELINMNLATTTVYGNLGSLHSALGNYDDAVANCRLSIQNDEKNPAPYQNLAKLYFDNHDFENAKRYALDALRINHKFRQPATLLAVIYSLEGDEVNAEKYSHIALSCGENPARLKEAIKYFKESVPEKSSTDEQG